MSDNGDRRNRVLNRLMNEAVPTATYPLPIADTDKTLHTLIGLFPLDTLIRLSRGLSEAVEVIKRCGSEPFALTTPPARPPAAKPPQRRVTSDERQRILELQDKGETLRAIATAVGRSPTTVQSVCKKKTIAEGGAK
jgi:hypothetical protein